MATTRMAPTVRALQSRIGYTFQNARYLWEAVQAPGSIIRVGEVNGAGTVRHSIGFQRVPDGNRRLAALGDTVLRLAITEEWYRGNGVRERFHRVVSDVGSNANLNTVGRTNGLDALINKSPREYDTPVGSITMAATVEAILAAVYLDGGMRSVMEVMRNLGLIPRIVRKTIIGKPVLENKESPAVSTSPIEDEGEPEMAPKHSNERLKNAKR